MYKPTLPTTKYGQLRESDDKAKKETLCKWKLLLYGGCTVMMKVMAGPGFYVAQELASLLIVSRAAFRNSLISEP